MRFLHTADWQLGLKLNFIEGDRGARARLQRFDTVREIARLAHARQVDFVLVAGDVFDDTALGPATIQASMDALDAFAPIPVYLLPGNHDAGTPDGILRRLPPRGHVHVLCDRAPVVLPGGAQLHPCPLLRRHESTDPTAHLPARAEGDPVRIAVAHGGVLDFTESGEAPNRIDAHALVAKGFDYLALGDWHGTLSFGPRIWYAGAHEATRFKEQDPGNVLVVELERPGDAPRVEKVRVAATRWLQSVVQVDTAADLDALEAWFAALPLRSMTLVELRLRGSLSLADRNRLDRLLEQEQAALLHLRVAEDAVVTEPTEADLSELPVEGYVRVALDRLRLGASEADRDAVRLLHRLLTEAQRA